MKVNGLNLLLLILLMGILGACRSAPPAASDQSGIIPASRPLEGQSLIVYSGRSENLIAPIIENFETSSGVEVKVRWGGSSELAAVLLEEGDLSPADIFFAQDPGSIGAVESLLQPLHDDLFAPLLPFFQSEDRYWLGISGRARTVVYNTDRLTPEMLPDDLWGFTDPIWNQRLGWAPTNSSFHTMITALRVLWGEEETIRWLEGILANEPIDYEKNTAIVAAVGGGEIDAGFVNHYYLFRFIEEQGDAFPAKNYFFEETSPGQLVMVAAAGILATSENTDAAQAFLKFLISTESQEYFANETFEYPVIDEVEPPFNLPAISEIVPPQINMAALNDLEGTLVLLSKTGVLP
jgi:iron(III) transport system substrate-binding protein